MCTCQEMIQMPTTLVGQKAPSFSAPAVLEGEEIVEHFSLEKYMGRKYVLLFFYPKDFTFVCPTELHAFQDALPEFDKRNTHVVACSTDSVESHFAWLQQLRSQGGVKGIIYPMVSDINKTIAASYGVLAGRYHFESGLLKAEGTLVAYRGWFLIDKAGIVQHQLVNHLSLGRSVPEALRVIDALQQVEQSGEVCPANWQKGDVSMKPDADGLRRYFQK